VLIFQHHIYRRDLRLNRGALYVFGDNEKREGLGGQAGEMRGEPNAVGVATLRAPGLPWNMYETKRQCGVVDNDLIPVVNALLLGGTVIFPSDGIGTGLANLAQHAPDTFQHVQRRTRQLGYLPIINTTIKCVGELDWIMTRTGVD
jgi:hypothetical protein